MPLKTILVHLDSSALSEPRLKFAVALAARQGARLLGVFAQLATPQQVGLISSWPSAAYVRHAEANRHLFFAHAGHLPQADWQDANRGSSVEVVRALVERAFAADLVVIGQEDERTSGLLPEDLGEQVVMNAGRPLLLVPSEISAELPGEGKALGQTPVIVWNQTREAARAVHDAIPLLAGCQQAHLVAVGRGRDEVQETGEQMRLHLASHGVNSRLHCVVTDGGGVMDSLLMVMTAHNADLLMMGAAGSTGFASWRRRGGTRNILRQMFVPVLMSQ